jgi:phospholipase/lecithinase/hemolysin
MLHPTLNAPPHSIYWTVGPRVRAAVIVLGLALVTLGPERVTARSTYDGLVVFGTSLSDSGNAFAIVGGNNTPPDYWVDDLLFPFVPYARGGHHLSDGATWIEQMARPLALAGSVQPAYRSPSRAAMNFAVAEARARDHGGPNQLAAHLAAFFQRTGGHGSADSLIVIEMGSNDVNDAFRALLAGGSSDAVIDAAVDAISGSIVALHAAGGRQFLVWNAPDLGLTPAARAIDLQLPGAAALLSQLAWQFSTRLATELAGLSLLPGIDIDLVDVFHAIQDVVLDPASFGLTNVSSPCITPGVPPFTCQQPDEFLFWDGIHPTHAGHAIIAAEAMNALGL